MDIEDEYLIGLRRVRNRGIATALAILMAPVPGFFVGALLSMGLFGDYTGRSTLLVFGASGAVALTTLAVVLARRVGR